MKIAGRRNQPDSLKCDLASEVLRSFGSLRLQVNGWSMLPSIFPGDTLWVESATADTVAEGEIVLLGRDRGLVAHRVTARTSGEILTRGDGMPQADSPVRASELLGRVAGIVRQGRRIEPRRKLHIGHRAIAALVRRSTFAARVVVRAHNFRHSWAS